MKSGSSLNSDSPKKKVTRKVTKKVVVKGSKVTKPIISKESPKNLLAPFKSIFTSQKKTDNKPKEKKDSNQKGKTKEKEITVFSQNFVPVRTIKDGIIMTTDGRYVMMLEILPINFRKMPIEQQRKIVANFGTIFNICPGAVQFKTMTDHTDINLIISNIKRKNKDNKDSRYEKAIKDYIEEIKKINKGGGIIRRYYLIFQYDGGESGVSRDFKKISRTMYNTYAAIRNILDRYNTVVVHNDETMFLLETLYNFYNRNTCKEESYLQRNARIWHDRRKYYASIGKEPLNADVADFIAPKGIDFKSHKQFITSDGLYYTYLYLNDNHYPSSVVAGWLDFFGSSGIGVDVDFIIRRLPKEITKYLIDRGSSITRVRAQQNATKRSKFNELANRAANSERILQRLEAGEDVYDCATLITIWNKDPETLIAVRDQLLEQIKSRGMRATYSDMNCISFFKMTAPLLDIQNDIFRKAAHNFTTSQLASVYNYTTFQLFDETGIVLGYNIDSYALVAINPHNTKYYKSGNMFIAGTTGSGKSFTEMLIGRRLRLLGIGTYYILPVKGHEYKDAAAALGGLYIPLMPGSSACINFMEIRPEGEIDKDYLDDEIDAGTQLVFSQSLLAKQISFITTLIALTIPKGDAPLNSIEINALNKACRSIYEQFGINDDNASIYDKNGNLKRMPIPGDLYNRLKIDSTLKRLCSVIEPFVHGSCKNMNQQTNIDLKNKCIVFDINQESIGSDLLPAFMYIAFWVCYGLVKSDTKNFDVVFLDEIWQMLKIDACAEQVERLVKLIRGYAGSVILATQDIHDCTSMMGTVGKSIITNTKIKFIMGMEESETDDLQEVITLTEDDVTAITAFHKGEGLLISNRDHIKLKIEASELETMTFTTDLNEKRRYAERLKVKLEEGD